MKIVSRPDVLCGGGEKTSGHSRNAIILYHINLLTRTNGVPSMSVMSLGAEAKVKAKS